MKTKTTFLLLAGMLLLCNGCITNQTILGDGNIITKEVSISDYTVLEVGGSSINLQYEQSEQDPYLRVVVDENIYDMYKFNIEDGNKLKIRPKDKYKHNYNFRPTEFTITTNSRSLHTATIAGSVKLVVNGPLTTDKLKLRLAGSGSALLEDTVRVREVETEIAGSANIRFGALYCDELDVDLAGSGSIHLAGSARDAEFDIAGSGTVSGFDFQVKYMKAKVAGSGDIDISVSDNIDLKVAGSGNIQYKGDPQISSQIAGSGKVKKVD